ncbi:hypothetical protein [Rossellomorea vietnamensis]|uniref:hypothetical protein n=1 Tax=Rossellomorea vietnamensis TaxID=218284 RepID=UPI003984F309
MYTKFKCSIKRTNSKFLTKREISEMYKKICNRCTRSSFSSSENGEWLCPSCGNNLTESQFYKATIFQNITQSVTSIKKLEKYKN